MRPGILLDRDGTIIEDYHYVGHIERVQLKLGAAEAIARFNRAGIPVAIVTNQSGVARGFYPESNVTDVHNYIAQELARHGAHIDLFLYSPHHPDGNIKEYVFDSYYHKPSPGMALQAAFRLDLDLRASVVVGDRPEDVRLAHNVKAHCVYLGQSTDGIPGWIHPLEYVRFNSLTDAAGYIIERITGVTDNITDSTFPTMSYSNPIGYWAHYADELYDVAQKVDKHAIERASNTLYRAYSEGSTVFAAGNGGSAAIATHFVTDHVKHMSATDTLFPNAHSLVDGTSLLTATANDIGYDAIFSYQLERRATRHDVLVAFSVGGQSANIVRAAQCAKEMGMTVISIVGGDGGKLAEITRTNPDDPHTLIHIPAWNYGIAEDIMQMLSHALAQYIRQTQMSDKAIQSARF